MGAGDLEGETEQSLRSRVGDGLGFAGSLIIRIFAVLTSREEPFRGSEQDHEVDVLGLRISERHGHPRTGVDWPHTGEQVEMQASFDLRHDLDPFFLSDFRLTAGAE